MERKSIPLPDWFKKSAVYPINPRTFSTEGTILLKNKAQIVGNKIKLDAYGDMLIEFDRRKTQ